MLIDYASLNKGETVDLDSETIITLHQIFSTYEEKLLLYIRKRKFQDAENMLVNFCMKALQLPDEKQLFVTRFFFTSFITTIVHKQNKQGKLPLNIVANAYELIYQVEQWKNISEYMLHISSFLKEIRTNITVQHLLFRGNKLVKEALGIIYHHLKCQTLTVRLIASKLDISPTHLTNLFKTHLNTTPSEYIAHQKVEAIMKELNQTNECLHTVRERFGFQSHSHFIQFFKKQTNLTPLQYLQQHVY